MKYKLYLPLLKIGILDQHPLAGLYPIQLEEVKVIDAHLCINGSLHPPSFDVQNLDELQTYAVVRRSFCRLLKFSQSITASMSLATSKL